MALWKDSNTTPPPAPAPSAPAAPRESLTRETDKSNVAALNPESQRRAAAAARPEPKESVIGPELTIEGKIEGTGHVRIAGRFKGDVRVDGNLTLEPGAHLNGQVHASVVTVGGELQGNIDTAKRVELLEGGVINGDVKAGSLTVAAGSRMRGQVEFGWDDKSAKQGELKGFGSAS